MTTTTISKPLPPNVIFAARTLWIVVVLINFVIFSLSVVYSYRESFEGEVFFDIGIETIPEGAYHVGSQFTTEQAEDGLLRVTSVTETAAAAGLRVGDLMRPAWLNARQNMPITLTVQSAGEEWRTVTLIASEPGDGAFINRATAEAQAAGLRIGDMLYGDFIPWIGEVGTPVTFTVLQADASEPTSVTLIRKPALFAIRSLTNLGFSVPAAASFNAALTVLVMLVSFSVALVIFSRRSADWMALLFSWALSLIPIIVADVGYLPAVAGRDGPNLFVLISASLSIFTILAFPDGKLQPRWSLLLVVAHVLINFNVIGRDLPTLNALNFIALLLVVGYRYRRYFNAVQRHQTQWVMYALVLFTITQITPIPAAFFSNREQWELAAVAFLALERFLNTALLVTAVLFIAFAILRYRLYDIDVVINRSLVGALVTFALTLIFIPSVFVIQSVIGAENTLISFVVSAALPVMALRPLRMRTRQFVDQRLYGLKFDLNQLAEAQKKPPVQQAGLLTGTFMGQYEVLDFIGKGGMGDVYKGYADGKTVALKTLASDLARQEDFLRRFQRETEIMQALDHPHIVRLYDAGQVDGLYYLAMEYIEGRELKQFLQQRGRLTPAEVVAVLGGIAQALDYLHRKGIVHRDLKPSNIMLREDHSQQAVLMDFGIAKVEDGKTRLTGSGVIGTIDYMAPEQILTARSVDHRADIYALGVIVYELLTGETPFTGGVGQILFAHLQQPAPDPRDLQPDLPRSVAHAVERALAKDPEERFASAGELIQALAAVESPAHV